MIANNGLPKGWEMKKLREVCEVVRGGSPRPMGDPKYFFGKIPFLKIADITKVEGKFVFDAQTKVNELGAERSRLLKKGSLVLTNSASVCIPKFLGVDACIHDGFVTFQKFKTDVSLDFLYHYFNYVRPYVIQTHKQGVTQVNLNIEIVNNFEILPPLPTQHTIVAKIEQLFSELDKGKEQLETARQQLKVYRQAVLKWAFEGRLTHTDVKEGEVPEGWKWLKLGEIAEKIFDGPFGSNLKSSDYVADGVRVIRLENIGVLEFKDEYQTFVTEEKYSTIQKHTVSSGDIVFSSFIIGETRVTVLPKHIQKAINKADCFCVRILSDTANAKYIAFYLSTKALYNQLVDDVHGATRPRINTTQLKSSLIPLCSLSEQHRIVAEIESRLSVCDQLEATITSSLAQAEALRQSVLKRVFEGKLT